MGSTSPPARVRVRDMDLVNKTRKAVSVPLPGGKKLFLGPGKKGQVHPKALKTAAVRKLIDAGVVATSHGTSQRGTDIAREQSPGSKAPLGGK